MAGSATLTIVMSRSSMKVPRQTATRVHHFVSAGEAALTCWPVAVSVSVLSSVAMGITVPVMCTFVHLNLVDRCAAMTKERILTVARGAFARHGFDGPTVRAIAAEADVSPNLITRYFGGKGGLFRAATNIDLDVPNVLPGAFSSLGRRIASNVVSRRE